MREELGSSNGEGRGLTLSSVPYCSFDSSIEPFLLDVFEHFGDTRVIIRLEGEDLRLRALCQLLSLLSNILLQTRLKVRTSPPPSLNSFASASTSSLGRETNATRYPTSELANRRATEAPVPTALPRPEMTMMGLTADISVCACEA